MKQKKQVATKVEANKPKFVVKGKRVSWKYRRGVIELTLDELDSIFYEYSKHGLDKSQTQVRNDYGLDALQWQSLKRTFDLVKDSDVFSPYSLSLVSDKEACDMIAKKIGEKYNPKNMRAVVAYEAGREKRKAYDRAIKRAADLDYRFEQLEAGLLDYVSEAKPKTVRKAKATMGEGIVHICDLHAGAKIEKSRNLPAYGWQQLIAKLDESAEAVNQMGYKEVTIVLNGDFIETFTGLNHANSWKNIDEKFGYGIPAVIKVTECLSDFLSKVDNIKEVILISGNHDRVTSSNKEDVEGEVARLIRHTLNAQYGNHFPVTWEAVVASRKIDGCGFIFTHGHLGLGKRKGELIVNQYGFKNCYNIVVMGHLHTRKTISDTYDSRVVHAPSLFTGNNYSKGLGYSSCSGFLHMYVQGKRPVVIDYPLT